MSSPQDMFPLILEREEGGEREKEREKHLCEGETSIGCLPSASQWGNQTCDLGMCPNGESNQQLFDAWNDTLAS